jgi:hypothetical protein
MASLGHMAMRSLAIVGSTGIRGGLPQCLVSLHFPCSNFPNRRAELWKAFKSHPRANVGELRSMSQGAAPSGGAWTLEELVNLSRYPLEEKGPALEELVQKHAKAMERDGFCVLRGFVRPDAARNMLQEVVEVAEDCFVSERNVNPWGENPEKYASTKNKTLPSWHPRRKGLDSAAGVVTCDELPSSGALKTLYAEDHLLDILTRIAGAQQPLCRHADELAACTASVLDSGHSQEWEFVRAPLAAMVVLQNANLGGEIQILPSVYDQVEMGHEVATEVRNTYLVRCEESPNTEPGLIRRWCEPFSTQPKSRTRCEGLCIFCCVHHFFCCAFLRLPLIERGCSLRPDAIAWDGAAISRSS